MRTEEHPKELLEPLLVIFDSMKSVVRVLSFLTLHHTPERSFQCRAQAIITYVKGLHILVASVI